MNRARCGVGLDESPDEILGAPSMSPRRPLSRDRLSHLGVRKAAGEGEPVVWCSDQGGSYDRGTERGQAEDGQGTLATCQAPRRH